MYFKDLSKAQERVEIRLWILILKYRSLDESSIHKIKF